MLGAPPQVASRARTTGRVAIRRAGSICCSEIFARIASSWAIRASSAAPAGPPQRISMVWGVRGAGPPAM
jgi:hypothetical protein